MGKIFKIIIPIVVVIAGFIVFVFVLTGGVAKGAENFFNDVKKWDIDKAYQQLSEEFKSSVTKDQLINYLEQKGAQYLIKTKFNSRNISGQWGTVEGYIEIKEGAADLKGSRELKTFIKLIKKGEKWKIYSIKILLEQERERPLVSELMKLVSKTMKVFAKSISEKSMKNFYNYSSHFWQKQSSLDDFEKVYSKAYKLGDKLNVVNKLVPQFTNEPLIDKDGVLVIKGEYKVGNKKIIFEHKYLYEGIYWKIAGFHFGIK